MQLQKSDVDRTDTRWAAMQATLAEVEQSAMHNAHFFGADQLKALEELRNAQIELAQAWARGEGDGEEVAENLGGSSEQSSQRTPGPSISAEASNGRSGVVEGTDDDIVLAKRRREANERYFNRISKGVGEVVGKLEKVAGAMSKVEKESREIWSDSETEESDLPT